MEPMRRGSFRDGGRYGHLALTEGALPVLVPVVYRVDDDELTVWAAPGLSPRMSDRHEPDRDEVVAFQTGADLVCSWAWSALVQGRAHRVVGRQGRTGADDR